mmetsp:Transcript_15636/g.20667  ORF Transcript_15636/g.20667 Transcript_15636/m.20667 type:complete len:114 (+) Transcript_15636:47-388(+)
MLKNIGQPRNFNVMYTSIMPSIGNKIQMDDDICEDEYTQVSHNQGISQLCGNIPTNNLKPYCGDEDKNVRLHTQMNTKINITQQKNNNNSAPKRPIKFSIKSSPPPAIIPLPR